MRGDESLKEFNEVLLQMRNERQALASSMSEHNFTKSAEMTTIEENSVIEPLQIKHTPPEQVNQ